MSELKKICKYCGKLYPEDAFGIALTTIKKIYRRRKCRNCYRLTKQALIRRHYHWLSDYKQQRGCSRCGISDPRVLDFHHNGKESKNFTIGGFRREVGAERLKKEIKKCLIVCANCHRILHDELRKSNDIKNGA